MKIIVLLLVIVCVLSGLHYNDKGRPASEPKGFAGIIATLLAGVAAFFTYYFAGAFSEIF